MQELPSETDKDISSNEHRTGMDIQENIYLALQKDLLQIEEDDILNVYLIGSRVYGTATETSDWYFIIFF